MFAALEGASSAAGSKGAGKGASNSAHGKGHAGYKPPAGITPARAAPPPADPLKAVGDGVRAAVHAASHVSGHLSRGDVKGAKDDLVAAHAGLDLAKRGAKAIPKTVPIVNDYMKPQVIMAVEAAQKKQHDDAQHTVDHAAKVVATADRLVHDDVAALNQTHGTLNDSQMHFVTQVALKQTHLPATWDNSDLHVVWTHEDRTHDVNAQNPTSTAHGLYQLLYNSGSTALQESVKGLEYINSRYHGPAAAANAEETQGWY
jgi:hypothetical protein